MLEPLHNHIVVVAAEFLRAEVRDEDSICKVKDEFVGIKHICAVEVERRPAERTPIVLSELVLFSMLN